MIFVGDVAVPYDEMQFDNPLPPAVRNDIVIANLEGAITSYAKDLIRKRKIFNSVACLTLLRSLNVKVVSGANNHILDVGALAIKDTIHRLGACDIQPVGFGSELHEATQPHRITERGQDVVVLAFGWEVAGCISASTHKPGINPLRPRHVIKSIRAAAQEYPSLPIVVLMHWNYELELYPQPMDRQLAFQCIDSGASAVIGCHPHCVSGIEWYCDAPIVYSLGNWHFPIGEYWNRKLSFPERCDLQLAFQWHSGHKDAVCHWFLYRPSEHAIEYLNSEPARISMRIAELTPFSGLSHPEYKVWFRENRIKRMALPVFDDCEPEWKLRFLAQLISIRRTGVDVIRKFFPNKERAMRIPKRKHAERE